MAAVDLLFNRGKYVGVVMVGWQLEPKSHKAEDMAAYESMRETLFAAKSDLKTMTGVVGVGHAFGTECRMDFHWYLGLDAEKVAHGLEAFKFKYPVAKFEFTDKPFCYW
jgi:hypothetical protein